MFWTFLFVGVVILISGLILGVAGMVGMAVLLVLLVMVGALVQWAFVRVPELNVAVVYNREREAFSRFLPAGRHWIVPFLERVEAVISTEPATVRDKSMGIQTSGGISLTVHWSVSYNLNPMKVSPAYQAKAARVLPRKTAVLLKKHMHNCLQHIIGEYTVMDLVAPGAHKRLERAVRQLLAERVGNLGIEISRVMMGEIEMPAHVRAALEAAHERQVQAEQEARALAHLQRVISQFSAEDMQRLMELERIQALGRNGVTLVYPPGGWGTAPTGNGRSAPTYAPEHVYTPVEW
ncbi:MAG: SPFH domain-containing protein [Chloroflexi bacterium]|nr:MAG: SPFH domain-containing protein [Chloroflexota bacterium]